MKHLGMLSLMGMLSVAGQGQGASAPANKPAAPTSQAQPSPQPPPTLSCLVDRQISASEKAVVEATDPMPSGSIWPPMR